MTTETRTGPAQSLPVYRAADLRVTSGANVGDALSFADELDAGDVYQLHPQAALWRMALMVGADGDFIVAPDTRIGTPGARQHLDCCLTLMAATGETTEVIVLVEVDTTGCAAAVFALPLAPLTPKVDYALVGIDREGARRRLAEVACVSFARGTHITMASGEQRPIEALKVGDGVLTRDQGVQRIRWIGLSTARAVGDFAPIRIHAGALNNARDLLVSPEHRLFIYQRADALGAGRAEVLVRARYLVNGTTVTREPGGFVDYFQLLFDDHQIIYAEGIAAETLLIDPRTRPALPRDLAQSPAGRNSARHLDFEVTERLLSHPDTAEILRRASTSG